MIPPEITCIIYVKIEDYYYDVFRLSGEVSSTVNDAIAHLNVLINDPGNHYTDYYLVIVHKDSNPDKAFSSVNDILKMDPVITIKDSKSIDEYQKELDELLELSGVVKVKQDTSNTMLSYKRIIDFYTTISDDRIELTDEIFEIISNFSKVIKKYDADVFEILMYLTKGNQKLYQDVLSVIKERSCLNLVEFSQIIMKFPKINIPNYLRDFHFDGKIPLKKKIFLKSLTMGK